MWFREVGTRRKSVKGVGIITHSLTGGLYLYSNSTFFIDIKVKQSLPLYF